MPLCRPQPKSLDFVYRAHAVLSLPEFPGADQERIGVCSLLHLVLSAKLSILLLSDGPSGHVRPV
jgi:hypothetical protein